MSKRFRYLGYLLGLLCFSGLANALVITHTEYFSNNWVRASTGWNTGFKQVSNYHNNFTNLAGFDSSLGMLTGVSVSYTAGAILAGDFLVRDPTDCAVFCEDNVLGSGSISSSYIIDLYSPEVIGYDHGFNLGFGMSCGDDDGYCNTSNSQSRINWNGELFSSTQLSTIANFIDTSLTMRTYNNLYVRSENCPDAEDECYASASSTFSGYVSVSYTYDEFVEVSEPASLALLSLGLLALVFRRRTINSIN